jgi:hypothetical protein
MARYKGRSTPKSIERDFPHIVEMAVPLGGLGRRLDAMHAFHLERGIQSRNGRRRRDQDGRDHIRWCFADAATAEAFASQFGGRRLIEPMPKDDPSALVEWAKRNVQRD